MDEAAFWKLIDKARGARSGTASPRRASADPERLRLLLEKESDETVAAFEREFARQMTRLHRWAVWGAAYAINGGASEDGFLYFCEWLIGKGQAAVEQALRDPDRMGPFVETDDAENEGLGSVASQILEARGVESDVTIYPEEDPQGEPFDEDEIEAAYPRLTKRFL